MRMVVAQRIAKHGKLVDHLDTFPHQVQVFDHSRRAPPPPVKADVPQPVLAGSRREVVHAGPGGDLRDVNAHCIEPFQHALQVAGDADRNRAKEAARHARPGDGHGPTPRLIRLAPVEPIRQQIDDDAETSQQQQPVPGRLARVVGQPRRDIRQPPQRRHQPITEIIIRNRIAG